MSQTPRRHSVFVHRRVSPGIRGDRQSYLQGYGFAAGQERNENKWPNLWGQLDSILFRIANRRPRLLLALCAAQITFFAGLLLRAKSPWLALAMVAAGGLVIWAGLRAIRLLHKGATNG